MSSDKPRILILTAGYGDGHNSAARGIAQALEGRADCRVLDLFSLAMPKAFKVTRRSYLWMIENAPSIWRLLYDWTDATDMSQPGALRGLEPVSRRLSKELDDYKPDMVVSTYMVYPYMLDGVFEETGRHTPYLSVVTDSLIINKTWVCYKAGHWAVTDEGTRDVIANRGVDREKVFVTGFAVSPRLAGLSRANPLSWKRGEPFRILYFPHGTVASAISMLEGILAADSEIQVTCVLGHSFRRYYKSFLKVKCRFGSRVILRGWTKKVPELMASHHLVVGKAGGATLHECIAMARPILVNYAVPGQEEGNVELIERLGGGRFVPNPMDMKESLVHILENDGALWRSMYHALLSAGMNNGANAIVDWCLERIHANSVSDANVPSS